LSIDTQGSWRTIGHTFASAGILLVITSAATLLFANKIGQVLRGSTSTQQADFANIIVTPISKLLVASFADYSLYFGIAYCLAGTICYVVAHRMRHNAAINPPATPNNAKAPLTQGS
jgi:hypothetical protein